MKRRVKDLDLSALPVTDAGLKELQKLDALESLNLRGTQITNAGLKEVATLQNLKDLIFRQSFGADSTFLIGQEFLEHLRDSFGGFGRFHDRPSEHHRTLRILLGELLARS